MQNKGTGLSRANQAHRLTVVPIVVVIRVEVARIEVHIPRVVGIVVGGCLSRSAKRTIEGANGTLLSFLSTIGATAYELFQCIA